MTKESGDDQVIDQTELVLLICALVCILLSVLGPMGTPAGIISLVGLALCAAEAIHRRRRTGRWSP